MKKILFLIVAAQYGFAAEKIEVQSPLINLVQTTQIIRIVVSQNKLGQLLEEHNAEQLNLLIDNVSPAQMAFEAEVQSTTIPLVIAYYFKDSAEEQERIEQLKNLAVEYNDKAKFIVIDAERLFSLAQAAELSALPAIVFIKNKELVHRMDGDVSIDELKQKINEQLS